MASGDAVQQIKERLSITDVVAPYVELKPAGKNLKGRCPFHNEKTPSFNVSQERNGYYCFGCSRGGDIFTFVEEMEGVDFKGALKILAEKAGVELVPENPEKRSERETGQAVLEAAAEFFVEKLRRRPDAEKYLTDRGVTAETIAKWRLGYAPGPPQSGWRELRTHLQEKKFTDDHLVKTGLIKVAGEGKEPYDVFRDRIMFPIFDNAGKVIAFSGRILSQDSDAPKYVNSPETEFFNKSEVLYGYDRAKQGIRKFDFSLIVEGQFDVVLCHQAGYTNTVAVSGTALTPHHVSLLQRLSNRVVLALDADRAGIAAVKRGADVMLARGIDVKVARVPEGSDPADLIKDDPAAFKKVIGGSTHVIEFLLAVLKEQAKDDRTYKLTVRDEVLPYLLTMQNKIDAEHFVGVVAAAIDTTKDAINLELTRLEEEARQRPQPPQGTDTATADPDATAQPTQTESRLTGLRTYLAVVSELLEPSDQATLATAFATITGEDIAAVLETVSAAKKSKLTFTLETEFSDLKPTQILAEVNNKLHELRLVSLRTAIRQQKELLYEAERAGEADTTETLLEKTTKLQKELAAASVEQDVFNDSANPNGGVD